jgi:ribosomal protein S12 methylthiotransferase accessory factor YcaO
MIISHLSQLDSTTLDAHLRARFDEFGITRLADISGLDRIGIPTHSCVKPGTSDVIWVYSGKGTTPSGSRISAIMECIERTAALWDVERVVIASRESLAQNCTVWGPEQFTEKSCDVAEDAPITWVKATHLRTREPVWVPADLVFTGRRPSLPAPFSFVITTSNGLGAGFSREQAITHALGEIIERDAVSIIELRASHFGAAFLWAMARAIGQREEQLRDVFHDNADLAPTIDRTSLPPLAQSLCDRYRSAGLDLQIKQIPNDLDVPVFGAAAVEIMSFDNVLATAGYGINLDPERALCAALLELAQSRATDRQGAREDCVEDEKKRFCQIPSDHWLATPGTNEIPFSALNWRATRHTSALEEYLERLSMVGLCDASVVDFTTYTGLYAVRVLVPGVETWHPTAGTSRLGSRAAKFFDWS